MLAPLKHSAMTVRLGLGATCLALIALTSGCTDKVENNNAQADGAAKVWPKLDMAVKKAPAIEARIDEIMGKMTLEQKVAQMIQPEIRDITVEDMRRYGFGSYLNGGGAFPDNNKHATPADWIKLAESMYQASVDDSLDGINIPTMWGTDAVHGHNNVIGATLFPHNIGLGAANNPALIERIAEVTATEVMVTGIDWVFAPTVAVVRDDRWGRTYEGYSEDPDIVARYARAIVTGLQGPVDDDFLGDKRVISTVKHFLGDGGTLGGDDQGNNIDTEQTLFDIHAQGYVTGLSAGAQAVMASFNSWHGEKIHGNRYLLTEVLKERMGFDGLVVGDWNGHGQIKGCSNDNCSQAINAGLDIYMVPTQAWKPLYHNTIAQVQSGEIPQSRIDDAVRRILRVKLRAGLFDKPSPAKRALSGRTELIGAKAHREVARQAVRESLVLLKNNGGLLPLSPEQHIMVAGDGADNIGKQSGGWTITWQGTGNSNADFPGGTSIYQGIKQAVEPLGGKVSLSPDGQFQQKPDVAIVVFGEEPYAEGNGDLDNLEYQRGNKTDLALLKTLQAQNIPVVSVFISGRPLWVNPELNASDAFVAAWLPGSEGQGIADVLIAKADGTARHDFKGRLSYSWPASPDQATVNRGDKHYTPLFPYGYGLDYQNNAELGALSEQRSEKKQTKQEVVLLDGTVKSPWKLFVGSDGELKEMNTSVLDTEVIRVRTIDKAIQEDARRLSFSGKGVGSVSIAHAFPADLRDFIDHQGVLSFEVRPESGLKQGVYLGMNCQNGCESVLDINPMLSQLTPDSWHKVSVAARCFSRAGVDMAKVFSPFVITSEAKGSLSIANIRLTTGGADSATLPCQ